LLKPNHETYMSRLSNSLLILCVFAFLGCSAAQKVGDTASGAAGAVGDAASDTMEAVSGSSAAHGDWDWKIDSPDGVFTGTFTIEGEAEALSGYMMSAEGGDEKLPLEDVMLDGDQLSFSFTNPDYGKMTVKGTVDGDDFNAILNVANFGVDLPMESSRKKDM